MSSNQGTTFGASVVAQPDEKAYMLPTGTTESPALTPAASRDSVALHDAPLSDNTPLPVHSPFYTHPPASHERVQSTPAKPAHLTSEKDLEYGDVTPYSGGAHNDEENPFSKKCAVGTSAQECTMWPTHQTLRQTRLADKKQRRQNRTCGCGMVKDRWAGLSKNQRLAIRILIALMVIGAIVGVAVGITRSVNGGVWSGKGASHEFDRGKGNGNGDGA
ncbi:hypothetical protein Q7P36_009486 [Cladosporium allicinum]